MKFLKNWRKVFDLVFLLLISILFINMTGGGGKQVALEPEFIKLKEGEGVYSGTIYDEKSVVDVNEISFTGHTSIGGIRKEGDDSVNVLDFAILKELRILNPNYISKRFSDKEFVQVEVEFLRDQNYEEFLVPRHVVICALNANTGQKKAWFLSKIQKITIKRGETRAARLAKEEAEQPQEEEGILGKIKSGVKTVVEKISP